MARPFPLNRQEAELLMDLLEANINDGDALDYDGHGVGEELLEALKKEFGMIKEDEG